MDIKTVINQKGAERINFNISAYRVLYILLLLIRRRSLNFLELNQHLTENPFINRAYNSETITKYINTLRKVGCQIPKAHSGNNFSYRLTKHPFPLLFEAEEIKSAQQLLLLLASQPDEEFHGRYYRLLQKVAWAIADEQQALMLFETGHMLASPTLQERRDLLARYKKLCREGMVLEIVYQAEESDDIVHITMEPNRVSLEGRQIYLLGVDCRNYQKIKLNLEKMHTCKQMPSKSQNRIKETTVLFELTGRLAKTYRFYPGETSLLETEDSLRIQVKTDDCLSLLRRLLKYGAQCEVLAPLALREEMRRLIDRLLAVEKTLNPVPVTETANSILTSSLGQHKQAESDY